MLNHSPSWLVLSPQATAHIHLDALFPAALFTVLAIVMVGLRWYSRLVCRPGYVGCEDWFVTVAVVCFQQHKGELG
jgi:hypothetical protein